MKKILLSIIPLLFLITSPALAKPIAGVALISSNSSRASAVAELIETHILNILDKSSSFSIIKPKIISNELIKFNCKEEKCILNFAKTADINLIISGNIQDRNNYLKVTLKSYAPGFIFKGKILHSYTVLIPLKNNLSPREFSLISEEHSGRFLAETISKFKYPIKIKLQTDKMQILDDQVQEGEYNLYLNKEDDNFYYKTGRIKITGKDATPIGKTKFKENCFIIKSFDEEALKIKNYYNNRKREIVFSKNSLNDTLYMFFLTTPASATMPLVAPFMGYLKNDDWSGLGLWAINTSPYLYIETRGQLNSPTKLKTQKKDISRDDKAMNYFSWYMLLAGGTPLFVDAFAHESLIKASYFQGKQELMGNSYTAAYLSLISNGGGHFYRGNRFWGYLYFHLNNSLLYLTLREYSTPEYYDATSGKYRRGKNNKKNTAILGSLLFFSKTIEVIHATTSKDIISNGSIDEKQISVAPFFNFDKKNQPMYGICLQIPF